MVEEQIEPINALLVDFSTRLNEIEEKQRLIKERVLLIGENLVSTKEDYEKQEIDVKKQLTQINYDIKTIKQLNKRIIGELENFARKTEVGILERQMKMFQPLEMAKMKEVKELIKKEIENLKKEIKHNGSS
ncbi:MAG: hypothetical protein WC867_06830 [Candidatus Pacearchaeota archaeon]|jgi:chromosome segregation ATPase